MAFNGEFKRNMIIAVIAATLLSIVIISSIILYQKPPANYQPNPEPEKITIGAKVANYLDSRAEDVQFGFSYNSTFANVNLSEAFNDYVDGFILYGSPTNTSTVNISVLQVTGVNTTDIEALIFVSVVNSFKQAFSGLNTTSNDTTWDDIWPPTFQWDIGFKDQTSLSIMYSKSKHILTVVNGTWEMSKFGLSGGIVVDFPNFEYDWEEHYNRVYFILDTASENLISNAIILFKNMIIDAFGL